MSKPLLVLTTLLGSLLVAGGAWMAVGADTVGDVPDAVTPVVAAPAPEPAPTGERLSSIPTVTYPDEPAVEVAAPVSLEIPSIGVKTPSVRVGLEDDGSMEIPEDVSTVGWYELGVAPGEAGSAVLAGHVDSRSQGRGAFFDLRELQVGDTATVRHEDGSASEWEVTGRTTYPKFEAPLPELFRRGGEPQLALITCGGEFDAGARSYAENVVVLLAPVV